MITTLFGVVIPRLPPSALFTTRCPVFTSRHPPFTTKSPIYNQASLFTTRHPPFITKSPYLQPDIPHLQSSTLFTTRSSHLQTSPLFTTKSPIYNQASLFTTRPLPFTTMIMTLTLTLILTLTLTRFEFTEYFQNQVLCMYIIQQGLRKFLLFFSFFFLYTSFQIKN